MPAAALLFLTAALAAPPGQVLSAPQLVRGDELVYRGEITEASDRVGNRFRKSSELEVRVFVIEVRPGHADCAVMTRVRPRTDPVITSATVAVTGSNTPQAVVSAAVRVDLARVDSRGRVQIVMAPPGPPPLLIRDDTPKTGPPANPLDGPPLVELGMFVPLPAQTVLVGDTWNMAEPDRPPVRWTAEKEAIWNGGRVVHLAGVQQTDTWNQPMASPSGWRRAESVLASPSDGLIVAVHRKIERRDGANVSGWVEIRYELQPPARHVGVRYTDVRRDAEAAIGFAADLAPLLSQVGKCDAREFQTRLLKLDRYLTDNPVPTSFRDGIEAVRRRCAAAARGEASPTTGVIPAAHAVHSDPPTIGKTAPDFAAPRIGEPGTLRLAALQGKPTVVVFFKPGSSTSRPTLLVTEALHKHFSERANVLAVSVSGSPDLAASQRTEMRLSVPVCDGVGVRERYGIDSYPRFFVVDRAGTVIWRFDGFGLETGYLAKEQVDKLLASESAKRTEAPQITPPIQPILPPPKP